MARRRSSNVTRLGLIATLVGALTLGVSVSPAFAGVTFVMAMQGTHTYTVGESVNLDLACLPTDGDTTVDNNWYSDGSLPDGLTYTNGLVTGIPTKAGTFSITGFNCAYTQNGNSSYSAGNGWTATFEILPQVSPTPSLWVTPVNNKLCEFRVMGMTPGQTESGAAVLTFAKDGSTWGPVILNDPTANSVFDFTVSALDLTSMSTSQQVSSVPGPSGNWCNSQTTLTFSYAMPGSAASSTSATFTPTQTENLSTAPSTLWSFSPEIDCGVRLNVTFPSVEDAEKPQIYLALDTFGYDIRLETPLKGEFYTFDFPVMDPSAMAQVDGVHSVTYWGDAPRCGSSWIANLSLIDGLGGFTGTQKSVVNQPLEAIADDCPAGSYSATGQVPCVQAGPGHFVPAAGAKAQTPCPLGSFSALAGATNCTPAPRGSYVATIGAITAKRCPTGQSTWIEGARYSRECYKLILQTISGVTVPAKQKFGAKIITLATTDKGNPITLKVAGACTAKKITQAIKVNGRTLKSPRWQIITSKKAGVCKLTYTSAGNQTLAPLKKVLTIKVSKTGN